MANHRATGRAQMRPLAPSGRGTHRDAAVVTASVAKVGVLGALATATIAVPLASATSGQGGDLAALSMPVAPAQAAAPAEPKAAVSAPEVRSVAIPATAVDAAAAPGSGVSAPADLTVKAVPVVQDASATGSDAEGEEATAADGSGPDASSEDAAPVASGGYIRPVNAPVTSNYGWRIHPTLHYRKLHDGMDFGAACGTPVKAAASGTVVKAEYAGSSGKRLEIDHGNGVVTGYFHLQSFDAKVGDTVSQGEVIGEVGSTGRSTGCHLHFATMDESGGYSNPNSLFR